MRKISAIKIESSLLPDRDTLLHLRLKFSFYLFPIFCFSLCFAESVDFLNVFLIFLILHFLVYPGSNIYNSYMDKDTESIGGLKNPPPATKKLYYMSIICDSLGLLLALFISGLFFWSVLIYILASKIYSWHGIRIKKYAKTSWAHVSFFQGAFTYFLVNFFSSDNSPEIWLDKKQILGMVIATLFIGSFYPLTQIYQHREDIKRGDYTLSAVLGIRGTFLFCFILLITVNLLLLYFLSHFYSVQYFFIYSVFIYPVALYFFNWFFDVMKDPANANYERISKLNNLSAVCMSACFLLMMFLIRFWG
jgi:1,4-dihydroxy-2-naphthoate polyprenyltransferase